MTVFITKNLLKINAFIEMCNDGREAENEQLAIKDGELRTPQTYTQLKYNSSCVFLSLLLIESKLTPQITG